MVNPGKWVVIGSLTVLLTGAVVAVGLTVGTPKSVYVWCGGVAAAALAAYLGQEGPRQLGAAMAQRRERRQLEDGVPLAFTARIRNQDYVVLGEGDRFVEVPASGHTVQLTVTGASSIPVVLTALRAEVVSRQDRSGDLARHAAEIPLRRFEVLLDADPPQVRALTSSDFPYQVKRDETEVFDLLVSAEAGDVRWLLWLDWSVGARSGSARIDLGGQEFRTAARHGHLA